MFNIKLNTDEPKTTEPNSTKDEVTNKAYDIYLKEGSTKGHAEQNWYRNYLIANTIVEELENLKRKYH